MRDARGAGGEHHGAAIHKTARRSQSPVARRASLRHCAGNPFNGAVKSASKIDRDRLCNHEIKTQSFEYDRTVLKTFKLP